MASTGFTFDPWAGLGYKPQNIIEEEEKRKKSVPTTMQEYFKNPLFSTSSISLVDTKPKKSNKQERLIEHAKNAPAFKDVSLDPEVWKTQVYDYNLNRWKTGLAGLDDNERSLWKEMHASSIQKYNLNEEEQDRVWRNGIFIDTFGEDTFDDMPDADDRDKFYYDYITKDALIKKYGDKDPNMLQFLSLTPEGREELLRSDYMGENQLQKNEKIDQNKSWWDYSLKERWNAVSDKASSRALTGLWGSLFGLPGAVIGVGAGLLEGTVEGLWHPEDAYDINKAQKRADNQDILHKIVVADNNRKKEESKDEISQLTSSYYSAYAQGKMTQEEVDKAFDDIALNGKRTVVDEFGNATEYDYTGSNYYSAFKDSDEFEHFSTYDKLKYLAEAQVIGAKYGQGSALSILDQNMQEYIADKQDWSWTGNTLKNIFVGATAYAMQKQILGGGALAAYTYYGAKGFKEALQNGASLEEAIDTGKEAGKQATAYFLEGKDASGDGTDNTILNAQYWNKVDKYNTFDTKVIEEADRNGGVSIYNNVLKPGTENDFFSWNTLYEAAKMSKFAIVDVPENLLFGKLVKGGTKLLGGVEMAPGVLATESTVASKVFNKVGSASILAQSSMGIDFAYGMNTYEEVLAENNSKLDKMINQDTEAELQKRINDPEKLKELTQAVYAENERRRLAAGEKGDWIPVDEKKAYNDWIEHVRREIREEQEQLHTEDREQAKRDAAGAYATDATIEAARMTGVVGTFRNYLFDKGTLNALKLNNPYVDTTVRNGEYALAKNATRKKMLQTLGKNIWGGGFYMNYMDDVTVGFAKGMGIQEYNNYLMQKYNPAAYATIFDDYVSPFIAGVNGSVDAATSKRAFLDGAIGALGTAITMNPNINRRSRKTWEKEAREAAERGETFAAPSWFENSFITNPVLQAYTDAKNATNLTEQEIKRVNQTIKDNGYSLDNMVETLSAQNNVGATRQGTSVMEAKDAKDKEAFALASSLLSLKNSHVVANAQTEVDKTGWSKKKRAAYAMNQMLNNALGVEMFSTPESQYTTAMQTLNDAATIGEKVDAETSQRQQDLVDTFLKLDANKSAIADMSQEEQTEFAAGRLKKNAQGLLGMIDKTEKLQNKFKNSIQLHHPDVQQQLIYQYALDARWKERTAELESSITGDEVTVDDITKGNPSTSPTARYGSRKGYERAVKSQEKRVEEAQKTYDRAKLESKKEADPTKTLRENSRIKAMRYFRENMAKEALKKEKDALKRLKNDDNVVGEEMPELTAEQILRLNADERFRMLDDFYRDDYSAKQQIEIDRAKNLLIKDGKNLNEAMAEVKDAAVLSHRIEDNMAVAKRIMKNPTQANMLQQSLKENRKRKVVDYFKDKIVADAFVDLMSKPENVLNEESVINKAKEYSSAVLKGMQRMAQDQLSNTERTTKLTDKTLQDVVDGVSKVLAERADRFLDNADLSSYLRKTKTVEHTKKVQVPITATVMNPETGQQEVAETGEFTEEEHTEKYELSDNDRKLLNYALDFAAERGISMDRLADSVASEAFEKYVQEKNHNYTEVFNPITGNYDEIGVGTAETMANKVGRDYMRNLVSDVIEGFNKHKEEVKKNKENKKTDKAKSVVTPPVEPKGSKVVADNDNEKRPDEAPATDDPFGVRQRKGDEKPTPKEEKKTEEKASHTQRNNEIIDAATTLNNNITEGLSDLLNDIDKKDMPEETRTKIKDIITSLVQSKAYDSIQGLKNDIYAESLMLSQKDYPRIVSITTALTKAKAGEESKAKQDKVEEKKEVKEEKGNTESPIVTPAATKLETLDLDVILTNPKMKVLADYANTHGMVSFLQKLSEVWRENYEKHGNIHQAQVVFLYDPALAGQVKESMENNGATYVAGMSAPIVMALEITPETGTDALVSDRSQLIELRDFRDNKTMRYYQPLGFMPANDNSHMTGISERMAALRDCIEFDKNETQILRYASATGKHNGSPIQTNLIEVQSHTEDEQRPFSTEDTPKKGVQQLMDENAESPTETLVKATEEEREEYTKAKSEGNLKGLRNTVLYKKLRDAFISRLVKTDKDGHFFIKFRLVKGTHDSYLKTVLVKKISETLDRNTGRLIIDELREVDESGDNAKDVINSNSRFRRLYYAISNLEHTEYDAEYAKAVKRAIENNLNIVGLQQLKVRTSSNAFGDTVSIEVPVLFEAPAETTTLATLTFKQGAKPSMTEFAMFLKNLILDKEGNPRLTFSEKSAELVKWQVSYDDARKANMKTSSEQEANLQKHAQKNLQELYDDGVLELQVTKLAYPARSVSVDINSLMRSRLYPTAKPAPEKISSATETKPAGTVEGKDGTLIDGDTGAKLGDGSSLPARSGATMKVINTILNMIAKSKARNLTADGHHYDINGQLYTRVTSIKNALEGSTGERINPENGWMFPASKIGSSADEFARDVFNGVFDNMSQEQRAEEFDNYSNSTKENFEQLYQSLKAFQVRLTDKGQQIVALGTREEPGSITAAGMLDVTYKDSEGKVKTSKVRVAGSIDAIAVDAKGNIHLYDFKTHRSQTFDKSTAIKDGYDRQLSMYAKFLENEYGIKVASINIIPIKVDYPIPNGKDNTGNPIEGAQRTYREQRKGSNQLEVKEIIADDTKFLPFNGANFQMEKEFSLQRLSDNDLTASYEKMTEIEKQAITDAIQEQSEQNGQTVEEAPAKEIVETKPEGTEIKDREYKKELDTIDDDELLFDEEETDDTSESDEDIADAIDNTKGLKKDLRDIEEACRGPKP